MTLPDVSHIWQSKRLAKMAIGQVERDYDPKVQEHNKVADLSWDNTKFSKRPNDPVPRSTVMPTSGPLQATADWAGRPLQGPKGPRPTPSPSANTAQPQRPPPPRRAPGSVPQVCKFWFYYVLFKSRRITVIRIRVHI